MYSLEAHSCVKFGLVHLFVRERECISLQHRKYGNPI